MGKKGVVRALKQEQNAYTQHTSSNTKIVSIQYNDSIGIEKQVKLI